MGVVYASFPLLIIQCTWTPEVKTPLHHSSQGRIILQTSSGLNVPPNHPHTFSESFIRQTLQGISKAQELGLLQELITSSPLPRPVFSPGQINFLAPQLIRAFSQATSEELIVFHCAGDNEGASQVNGTIAVFAPSIFFLTLKNSDDYTGNKSKASSSSRNLQKHTTLLFSQKQAVLPAKEASHFMQPSAKDSWIAINYGLLSPSVTSNHEESPPPPLVSPHPGKNQTEGPTLQEQLQDLREKVNEQAEEIQRLQQTTPH